ncbi:MAG: rod shape-determining protein MreC [Eubacteriales bacterium]|nr:rod shape-determining protein MreC [Eubacteriales bacterium]
MSPVIKKKRRKFTISSKYLLLILSGICVCLMIFTFKTSVFEGPLKAAAAYVVVPFQRGIASVGGYLSDRSEELARLEEVLAENEDLKQQIDELTIENNRLQQDRYELNNLRSLYELDQTYADYEKVGAHVIASEADNWFYSFTIDKGENDGIQVDCNVMAGSGLVGRVVSVGPNYAKVQSIINDTSNVSATVLATSENMIVSGDLQAMQTDGVICFGELSDKNGRVSVGDKVVTSSISDKYLPGILIGYINSINTSANNLTKSGYITPAVDFTHLEEVLVVMELKQQTGD